MYIVYTHTLVPEFFLVLPYTDTTCKMPFERSKGVIFITFLLILN